MRRIRKERRSQSQGRKLHDLSVKGEFVFSFLSFGVKIRFKPPLKHRKTAGFNPLAHCLEKENCSITTAGEKSD